MVIRVLSIRGRAVATRFRVLGDVEAWVDGRQVDPGHARQRAVLVALLVDVGRAVPTGVLAERVWGERLPARADRSLASYVSRLRQVLAGAEDVGIERRLAGYVVTTAPESVDLFVSRRLLAQARSVGADDAAAELFAQGLNLWRGEAFGGLDTPWINATRLALNQERLAAELDRTDVELRLGRHKELLARVLAQVSAYPLDERCASQLMTVLYRCGRQAEALECYQQIRLRLAEQLGVDPGQPLQQLHQRILNADPTLIISTPAPDTGVAAGHATGTRTHRQLPRDLNTFVGRDQEVATLTGLLTTEPTSAAGPVVVIHGAPGVGKSALAVRAAHLVMPRFPDGQLHVNLRGATPGMRPLSAVEAVHHLLRTLGVANTEIPSGVEEAAARLRTVVAGRRLLIMLDNAASTGQVRPLLPGGPDTAVLITSRSRLAALEGATHLVLGPLTPDEARMMLASLLPDIRPVEFEATYRLAELCDHLPLGLHVAAARLNARPSWRVHDMVDRLANERHRLTELAADDIALRSSLAVSHTALHDSANHIDRKAARALCLFGLLPSTDTDSDLAAAVLDTTPAEADLITERLLDAHLMEEPKPGRLHMHDLTRLFAHELGTRTLAPAERHMLIIRVLSYYIATTCRANALVYPHRAHHPAPEVTAPPKPLANHDEALQWLDEQHHNMVAVVLQAWQGPAEEVRLGVGLALALHWYRFLHSGVSDLPDTISFLDSVVAAAERLGHSVALAHAHGNLAMHLSQIGQLDQARAHLLEELAICQEIRDRFGEQRALGNLGHTHLAQRQPEQAIAYLQQQLDLARDIGVPLGQAFALVNLGKANHQLGNSGEAITMVEKGLSWYNKTGDHYRQCDAHEILAKIHVDRGNYEQAITIMTRGLDLARRHTYRYGEIWALTTLARAHRLHGEPDRARYYAEQAVRLSQDLHGTQVRADAFDEYARLPGPKKPPQP
ncbi:BTAD domain-containing putative transcriptional regulator [Actinophytocola sp.]|uniref:AfsR/SARP family transcriptional regulator n=1 Tax=Actinophytocola sp. TaxID=1872138 RepID=UPI00389B2FBE